MRSRVHRRTSTCSSCYSLRNYTQHRIRTKKVKITCIAARITDVFLKRQRKWQMKRFAFRGIEEQKQLKRQENRGDQSRGMSASRLFPCDRASRRPICNRCSKCELKGREVRSFDLFRSLLTDSSCATRRPCGQAPWVDIGTSVPTEELYIKADIVWRNSCWSLEFGAYK